MQSELEAADWWSPGWLPEALGQLEQRFERACNRWRGLHRAAYSQVEAQTKIILDASRTERDREQARRLRREAEAQLDLLMQEDNARQSDFYSYRYFANEGFLPGYSFPRLPLSAYLPGRRGRQSQDEFLSRPRFLAISEFGPRGIVYHEGSRYIINRVILPVGEDAQDDDGRIVTGRVKQCRHCGYLHPQGNTGGDDTCDRCKMQLPGALTQLFRMQNVATKRRDRITSDEEERQRMGYELVTGVRFAEPGGRPSYRTAVVQRGEPLATLTYGQAATLWRINMGWRRRRQDTPPGFVLDTERGYWATSEVAVAGDPDDPDPMSNRTMRVIPYVEDRRNCLLFEPSVQLDGGVMASLQAALKSAIQAVYQLEDNELAVEPLPSLADRRLILIYESAEGGAGVLRRLVDDADAFARVAQEALRICHFDPDTGQDLRHGPRAREDCEAACYDCLMSYYNQMDHRDLDRMVIHDLLMELAQAQVVVSPTAAPRAEHLEELLRHADSELERRWLQFLEERDLRLPSQAQAFIESCRTRPDFLFEEQATAIYVDGPPHDFPNRQARDAAQTECMEDHGYTVIRFRHDADWEQTIARFPNIFGKA